MGVTFRDQELAGWTAKAEAYDSNFGAVTARIAPALLDAAGVRAGTQLLDVASGPGYVAGAGAARGAEVTGVDFAAPMVEEARRRFPHVRFGPGDAEALAFGAGSFDAVTCGFGIGHFPDPDRAVREAARVLRSGGRYAFSWWRVQDEGFFKLFFDAVRSGGTLDVPLPPAPPFARFSDAEECVRALAAAGFVDARVDAHDVFHALPVPRRVLDMIRRSGVRSALVLEMQTPDARARIEEALVAGVTRFKQRRVPFPMLVASATRP